MKKVKIAQIGIGHDHASMILTSLMKQSDIFEFAGFVLPEEEKDTWGYKLEAFDGIKMLTLDEALNNSGIDAVAVETEEKLLTKYACMAAEHGKHIHMDKPGSQDEKAFSRLVETAPKRKLVFHLGYMYRYNPLISELIGRVKNGELGEIISVEAQMSGVYPPTFEKRQWLSSFEGGNMYFLGCHLVDLVLQIQGMPKRIIPLNKCTGCDGVTAKDYGMAVFEYENGVSFVKTNAMEPGGFQRRQLVVTGTKETVEIKPLEVSVSGSDHYTEEITRKGSYSELVEEKKKSQIFDRYDDMMRAFAYMVLGKKENPYTYEYELQLYKVILECCR